MKFRSFIFSISVLATTICGQPFALPQGCSIPFKSIADDGLDVDTKCTIDGNSGSNIAKKLESNAKNNFCVTGRATPITFSSFAKLEDSTSDEIRGMIKTDRSVLSDLVKLANGPKIGEGSLVQLVAYILDAHSSNVSKGELVNCGRGGADWNDIHIELVKSATEDDACNSVTAEMSPHFRPDSWTDLVDLSIKRPVRITGPLFFDGSHRPCRDGKRPSPNRQSVWEIHPVYQFEVCKNKSLSACKVTDSAVWIPLDQWHNHSDQEDDE